MGRQILQICVNYFKIFRIRLEFNVNESGKIGLVRDFFIRDPKWSKYFLNFKTSYNFSSTKKSLNTQ